MSFEFHYEFEGMNANHWIVTAFDNVMGKKISVTEVFKDDVTLNEVYGRMTDLLAMDALDAMSPYM